MKLCFLEHLVKSSYFRRREISSRKKKLLPFCKLNGLTKKF